MTGDNNIIDGAYIGGNFWARPDGTGWSQIKPSLGNGFCQLHEINGDGNNIDYLPLTKNREQAEVPAEEITHSSGNGVRVRISSSTEPPANIASVDSDIRFVGRDAEVRYVFSDRSTPVTDIRFEAEKTQGYVMASVSLLNELPDDVPVPFSAHTYQFMDIILGDSTFSATGVSEATIGFAVSKEWITSNNVDKYGIHMQHFSNGAWNRLSTTMTGEDENYLYFEAVTTGFSPFMICADAMSPDTEEYGTDSIVGNDPEATGQDRDTQDITANWKGIAIKTLPGLALAGVLGIIYRKKGSSKGKI
jgi:PGF-pre-PGF domain-containing protein